MGPTAVGKSGIAIQIAERLHTEVISCDSMQIYRGCDIGTAKVSLNEQNGIRHHLIDFVSPGERYSAAQYACDFDAVLRSCFQDQTAVVCGGTGLYVNAVLFPFHFAHVNSDLELRRRLQERGEVEGKEALWQELKAVDSVSAEQLHVNDVKRVIRALEIYYLTGKRKSEQEDSFAKQPKYPYYLAGLCEARDVLYERINRRVDDMVCRGLFEEVEGLLKQGVPSDSQAMQAIGYKEIVKVIHGECKRNEAIELIKQNSRNYAKRQMTFFRKIPGIVWYCAEEKLLAEKITEDYLKIG